MKSDKRGGIVGDLISGTGGIIILTVLVLVVVATLLGANLIEDGTSEKSVTGESGVWLNATTYNVGVTGEQGIVSLTLDSAINWTGATPLNVLLTNFTVDGTGFANASVANYNNLTINYTYTSTDVNYTRTTDGMSTNFTSGIDNVSGKIPTILLIGAVVLLFGVIILLMKQAGAMGIGTNGASL